MSFIFYGKLKEEEKYNLNLTIHNSVAYNHKSPEK